MAEANNPQTPAAGQPGSGAGTNNPPKKYAGKYDSLEEAVEKGYGGLEQGFNALNEKVANLTRLLEVAVTPQEPVPTVGGGNPAAYSDPYGRNAPPVNNQQQVVDFLTNPHAHLQAREEAMLQRVGNIVSSTVANAMAVADFKARHPELLKHEPLVKTFMQSTDPRKPIAERLEDAAKAAQAYIAQNFQAPTNPPPQGTNFVEPPSGGIQYFAPGSPPVAPSDTKAEEQALVEFLQARNADKALTMGVGYDPNDKK